jgi:hypothetical protein
MLLNFLRAAGIGIDPAVEPRFSFMWEKVLLRICTIVRAKDCFCIFDEDDKNHYSLR